MTDSELLAFREEYELSEMKAPQFATHKGLDLEKVRYALRKALKVRREASGEISFTAIKTELGPLPSKSDNSDNSDNLKNIVITTSNGTIIEIPS